MELYIGPPLDVHVEADDEEPSRPLTRFDSSLQLPVRVLSPPSPPEGTRRAAVADQDDGDHLTRRPPGSRRSRTAARTWSLSAGSARTSTTAASSWRCTAVGRRTRRAGFPTGALAGSPVLWRALFDGQPELEAAVAEHLEETTSSFNRRIKGWLEQGAVQRSDLEDLLQQVESVKQLAQLLSRRSDASRNESGARGEELTGPLAGWDRACPRVTEGGGVEPADSSSSTTCRFPCLPLDTDDPHEQRPSGDGR